MFSDLLQSLNYSNYSYYLQFFIFTVCMMPAINSHISASPAPCVMPAINSHISTSLGFIIVVKLIHFSQPTLLRASCLPFCLLPACPILSVSCLQSSPQCCLVFSFPISYPQSSLVDQLSRQQAGSWSPQIRRRFKGSVFCTPCL